MAKLLAGLPVKEKIQTELAQRVSELGRLLVLAIVQVGEREDSNIYIKNKIKFGEEIGVEVRLKKFPQEIFSAELESAIENLNMDESIDGIIVQLPLPNELNAEMILKLVKREKDPEPATARAVLEILNYYNIDIESKKICVVGQGILAGRAIADELESRKAQVARCDIGTKNIAEIARSSEILISAVGKAGLITKEYINENQVVIDVGISRNLAGKVVGDVLFEEVEPLVASIAPVPGGIGPVTVVCLFANLLDLVYNYPNHYQ